jgi:hypothetical protein
LIELAIVGALMTLLCIGLWAPVSWLLGSAAGLLALGLVVGVPTGLQYHVALRRELLARGPLPPRWWVRPTAFHADLDDDQRSGVLPWFYVGGVGFVLTAGGCVVLGIAAFRLIFVQA